MTAKGRDLPTRRLWRRWAGYSLRRKLWLSFVVVALVAVGTVSLFNLLVLRSQLTADVGRNLSQLAASQGQGVGDVLVRRVDALQALSVNRVLAEQLEQSNLPDESETATIVTRLQTLDNMPSDDPVIISALSQIMQSDVSQELLRFRNLFPANRHITVTNAFGGLEGTTDSASRFYVGDESWWQQAYRQGRGDVYIGRPYEPDELIIAVPIYGRGTQVVVGVLQATLPIDIFRPVLYSAFEDEPGQSVLYLPPDQLYLATADTAVVPASTWLTPDVATLDSTQNGVGQVTLDQQPGLAGLAPVGTADPGTRITIDQLQWQVLTYLPEDVALAPVNAALSTFVPAILVALVLSGLLVVPMAPFLTRPITNLTTVVRHAGRGNWGETVPVETDDEIGQLTVTYNHMSLKLAETMADLQQRNDMLETSAQVARAASVSLDLDVVLKTTVERISTQFGFYFVAVFLYEEAEDTAVLREASGDIGAYLKNQPYYFTADSPLPVGRVLNSRHPYILSDLQELAAQGNRHHNLLTTRAEAALPLTVGDTLLGVLDVHSTDPSPFSDDIVNLLTTLADQIAIAVQHAHLYGNQRRTAEKLAEADRLKSEFLATMSHELRTPLNSIIGFSKIILNGLDGPLTEQQTEDIEVIHRNGRHLLHLINQILDFSKLGAGKLDLAQEPVDLGPVLEEAEQSLRGLLEEKPVRVTVWIPEERFVVLGDAMRLRQVVLNLVSNAAKFTEEGHIGLELRFTATTAVVKVRDTGIGIPPDRLEMIFEDFTQVDSSDSRAFGGTGLGLPITKKIVELHGGDINVQSEYGRGSTFWVTLPLAQNQSQALSVSTSATHRYAIVPEHS